MVTIAHIVKKYVDELPFLQEAMSKEIISYGNLADELLPKIEKELGKKVKPAAIVMALRRYAESLKIKEKKYKFDFSSDIITKTNIVDIAVVKSPKFFTDLSKLYKLVNFDRGDVLNIIHGNNEVAIITNSKYKNKILNFLKNEKIINLQEDLISISLSYSEKFFYTPGVLFNAIRRLVWNNINIYEVISTYTELIFIIHKNDFNRAYSSLLELIEQK